MSHSKTQVLSRFTKLTINGVLFGATCFGADFKARVLLQGRPIPGATVTLIQGDHRVTGITDQQGRLQLSGILSGSWTLHIAMTGFRAMDQSVEISKSSESRAFNLDLLPRSELLALASAHTAPPALAVEGMQSSEGEQERHESTKAVGQQAGAASESANDGLLVNGSVNNAATSQFSLDEAFGNQHSNTKSLYNGSLAAIAQNSLFDARPFSLSGIPQPKADYNLLSEVVTFGGPLNIPRLLKGRLFRGPNLFVIYERTRNRVASVETGLVPTALQRQASDPVAANLLKLYPLPNIAAGNNYNYQTQVLNNIHLDSLQLRADRSIGQKDTLHGQFRLVSDRQDTTNFFGFTDDTRTLGTSADLNWQHRLRTGLYMDIDYAFSRQRTSVLPFFQNRIDVAGDVGVGGVLTDPFNWGPPTLVFSSGITSLTDSDASYNRNRSDKLAGSAEWFRGRHDIKVGGDFRRQEFNSFSQANPRGTFTFTGQAFGSDLADFLAGVPDTAALNYGNPDKYLRESVSSFFLNDDWRLRPELSLNIGLRWEYSAPITELKRRLANLDIAPGFTSVTTVVAGSPHGPLTGQHYPSSLMRPDYSHVEPRVALAWRPLPASSLVVRAGYGIYADTSVYQATSLMLAEQSPFATSLQVNNSSCPQTLRVGPTSCGLTTRNTFAVDPNFRVGYAQTWNLSAQRDLPGALVATITYLGVKGTRGLQDLLPNTYPIGLIGPNASVPVGFLYRTSNGNSIRNAGTLQLRRRLRSGLTITGEYTYSRSVDNDSVLGGQGPASKSLLGSAGSSSASRSSTIAQNWLDLRAERSLSNFDQRNLLTVVGQYTTGLGVRGGTLLSGWRGRLYKDWTLAAQTSFGSGLPETPIYLAAVPGTGYTGSIRPNRIVANPYAGAPGAFFNAAAFAAPSLGTWGTAGRNSLRGPGTYTFNSSVSRTFRLEKTLNLDVRADAFNLLNHVVYASYNNVINTNLVSPLFGVPTAANAMRSLQFTARLRF